MIWYTEAMLNGLHHLQARKRSGNRLDPYPHPVLWKRYLDKIIYAASIIPPIILIPQVWEVVGRHNATGIIPETWIGLGIINIVWILYGIAHKEPPITISNIFLLIINFGIAIGAFMWK